MIVTGGGLIKKTCDICGKTFEIKHPNQKYCSPKCRIIARKRQIRINVDRYRENHKEEIELKKQQRYDAINNEYKKKGVLIMEQYQTGKGTTSLGPKPNENFDKEEILIKNELKRLKLRT